MPDNIVEFSLSVGPRLQPGLMVGALVTETEKAHKRPYQATFTPPPD